MTSGSVIVSAPHLCAMLIFERGAVVRAAPILRYMLGWNVERVRSYAGGRGWRLTELPE